MTSSVSPDIFSDTTAERRYRISQEIERLRRDNELAALNLMAEIEGQTPHRSTLEQISLVPSDQSVRSNFDEMPKGMMSLIFEGLFEIVVMALSLAVAATVCSTVYFASTKADVHEVSFALKAFVMAATSCVAAAGLIMLGFIVYNEVNQTLEDLRAFKKYGAKSRHAWHNFSRRMSTSVILGNQAVYIAEFDGERSSARAVFYDAIGRVSFDNNIATNEKNQITGRDGRDIFAFPDLKRMHGNNDFVASTDSLWKTAFEVAGDQVVASQTAEK